MRRKPYNRQAPYHPQSVSVATSRQVNVASVASGKKKLGNQDSNLDNKNQNLASCH